ncbi:hypothetical protein MF672_043465 [Actinomadura sp. ATCC 31491]|uniref:Peptidase M48 domain-containing protein n=1 Tax=Actinomadura luzonensis TaxID=2805427 RepID=A0ABT0G7N7_9ACTN|nr:hypothetical protein [Actinomadura luzonensis]MCK2220616.1 hypothetical protein [Actinomadura luzonensis]
MKRLLALVLASLVHLMTLGFAAVGLWAIAAHAGSLIAWLLGGLSLAVAWVLRPHLPALPADAEVLERAAAPELHALADRVADRVGVRRPRVVALRDLAADAWYGPVGAARRPVLVVGLPLWLALPARQRVTLLVTAYARAPGGEELVVGGAMETLEAWREALMEAAPLRVREEAQTRITASSLGYADQPGTAYEVAGFFGRLVGRVLGGPVLLARYALARLAPASQEAVLRRQRERALRAVPAQELAELEALAAGRGYLAPMQAAALRGESVAAIREGALTRFLLTDDGVLTSAPDAELLSGADSDRVDEELRAHYARAVRGFGLIS